MNEGTASPLGDRPAHRALPVTGAWRPDDDPGDRRFAEITAGRPFVLEGGGQLGDVTVAYETWGELDDAASNAILICHAVTGDSHVVGDKSPAHPSPGWWDVMVGPGQPLDTDRYFVVCCNVLGGCQGTTGPASIDPDKGAEYAGALPGRDRPGHGAHPGRCGRRARR